MRTLIVEDDRNTADYLQKGLSENGFISDVAHTGVDGLHLALTGDYDLVVLDVMLPGMDGRQVIRELRHQKSTPVIFLSARSKVEDRVAGLELGADDYLVKPFAFSELLARIRTLLRRAPEREPDVLRVLDLEVDVRTRRVIRAGTPIQLTPKEFALLHLLLRRCGEVLSHTLIAEQVWDINFDSDTHVVEVAIRRLRSKVDEAHTSKLIHTVRGVGYVLEKRE
ncbi:MAG: heavy metal response regulator transcription factor [Betaproteobacteria bacterium]|nr:heavy metal response regulator transcription factor [Betaproteobacteria bacterium]